MIYNKRCGRHPQMPPQMPCGCDEAPVFRQEFDCGGDQQVIKHQHVVKHRRDIVNDYDVVHEYDINEFDVVRHRDVVRNNDYKTHVPNYCGCGAPIPDPPHCGCGRKNW